MLNGKTIQPFAGITLYPLSPLVRPTTFGGRTMKARLIFALASCMSLVALAADTPQAGKQEPQTFEKQVSIKLDYLAYVPPDYNKDQEKKWPLIVFLHGSGESGNDVEKVMAHGPPQLLGK